jgi:hypothetical protein
MFKVEGSYLVGVREVGAIPEDLLLGHMKIHFYSVFFLWTGYSEHDMWERLATFKNYEDIVDEYHKVMGWTLSSWPRKSTTQKKATRRGQNDWGRAEKCKKSLYLQS